MGGGALGVGPAIASSKPERLRHYCAIQEMGHRDGVERAQATSGDEVGKFLDNCGKAAFHKDVHRAGPHYGRGVAKQDAGIGGLQRKVEIGVVAGGKVAPRITCIVVDAVKFIADFGIDGAEHGFEQPGLVLEVVMQSATGDARLGGQGIKRDMGEALGGKGVARRCDQACGGLFGGLGPARCAESGLC